MARQEAPTNESVRSSDEQISRLEVGTPRAGRLVEALPFDWTNGKNGLVSPYQVRTPQPRFIAFYLNALVLFVLTASALGQAKLQTVHSERPWDAASLKAAKSMDPTRSLRVTLGLPLRNHDELRALLRDIYTPGNANYHHYLTASEFASRFGPDEDDYAAVVRFAESHGLKVTGRHSNRTLVDVQGKARDVEKAFHVHMQVFQHPTEARAFFAPDANPSVDLAVPLLTIQGLDNFMVPHPINLKTAFATTNAIANSFGTGPRGSYMGADFRASYAPGVALTGTGQTVGLLEFDGYYADDIAQYKFLAKLPDVPLTNVLLNGFSGVPGGAAMEVTADIDMAICMAPGLSSVMVYEGGNPNTILNQMATDNLAKSLSSSWGYYPVVDATRTQIFEQFAAQGQTMFQASGDYGAYSPGVISSPSDDPNLTIVGGTILTTAGPGGPWLAESAWSGGSGGYSSNFALPSWQANIANSANHASSTGRNLPDVAAIADSIWLIALNGEQGFVGGTSTAAPLWAGFAALVNQQAAAEGKPPIGFLNPLLYSIGRTSAYTSAFHDITVGNNTNSVSTSNYFAEPGYDLCTGWGSPAGSNLITALLSPPGALQIFANSGLAASGSQGGSFSPANQEVLLEDFATNSVNWSAGVSAPWLSLSPASGTVANGGTASILLLSVNSAASALPPGNYSATICFTNLADGTVQTRPFALAVTPGSAAPLIYSQPVSQEAAPGASAAFTVKAAGNARLTYQWQQNGVNVSNNANVTGATTATLTLENISLASAGTYTVIVSNSLGVAASSNAILTLAPITASGVAISNLYSFTAGSDGANPNGLMQASDGNFYGTTQYGGINSAGTAFRFSPAGALQTMFQFGGTDAGYTPQAALVQGADGGLYGTTASGGTIGGGIIFKITTNGVFATLYNFNGGDGDSPEVPMILGADGNLYGTTSSGGAAGDGEIFELTQAGALTQIGTFNYFNGFDPSKLTQGIDGSFYGTTFGGGAPGDGTVFNLSTNGLLTTLFVCDYTNGGYLPLAGLSQAPDGNLYGTTYEGGASNFGTLIVMTPLGKVTTLYSFTGAADGGHPSADLVQGPDGNFYGTTIVGGAFDDGLVFRWTPGSAPVPLASFDGFNGAHPQSALVATADGSLYGTTPDGGATGNGVIFRVSINSPTLQITSQPSDQSAFLGSTASFSVDVAGNAPISYQWWKNNEPLANGGNIAGASSRILTISNVSGADAAIYYVTISNAIAPVVTSENALLEVVTSPPLFLSPPVNQIGTVGGSVTFRAVVEGDLPMAFQWQSNHVNLVNNANVVGANSSTLTLAGLNQRSDATYTLIASNASGANSADAILTVYGASIAGTAVSSLHWFTGGADGGVPNGLALGSNGVLYGTTQSGGSGSGGTIFSVTTNGEFQTLVAFAAANGSSPQAGLTPGSDGNLYGTTQGGGPNGWGTVFMMTPAGALTTLAAFASQSNYAPYTALTQGTNGNFYGSSANLYKSGDGNIFEMTPSGSLSVIYSFTGGQTGNEPIGSLALGNDGNFYGMTTTGAARNDGGIFAMSPAGALTNLYSFTGQIDGYNPIGALVQGTDGYFYGVTRRDVLDGEQFDGTIFKVSTKGALTTLYTLNPYVNGDGEYPFAGLVAGMDGNFYGSTMYSESNIYGTVFRITPSGAYTTLCAFNGADDGAEPKSAMVQDAAGNLYGTTTSGGPYGKGSIFRLSMTGAPIITENPNNQITTIGGSAQFQVCVFGAPQLTYQWRKNGVNLADDGHFTGTSTRVLAISGTVPEDAAYYSAVVGNPQGIIDSAGASLTVVGQPVITSAYQNAGALVFSWESVAGQSYQVQSTTNLDSPNWANVGSATSATTNLLSATNSIGAAAQQFYRVVLVSP